MADLNSEAHSELSIVPANSFLSGSGELFEAFARSGYHAAVETTLGS